MPPNRYIVIAGNIGAGKTTIIELISYALRPCEVFREQPDIYLERYYHDPATFAFLNQLSYSLQFLEQAARISQCGSDCTVVQDRSIYDTHQVFSRLVMASGFVSPDEFSLLERIYRAADLLVRPTLLVVLDANVDVVFQRMRHRGHKVEARVSTDYLIRLRDAYIHWYEEFDLCRKVLIRTDEQSPEAVARCVLDAVDRQARP